MNELQFAELTSGLRHAQEHITALELTAYRQQQQIDLLQGQLRKLYEQMQGGSGGDSAVTVSDPREDIPPHY
jgi:SlyX protein